MYVCGVLYVYVCCVLYVYVCGVCVYVCGVCVWGACGVCICVCGVCVCVACVVCMCEYTDMRRLRTGIRSEKCVVRRFRRCANALVYFDKPRQYSIAYYTPRLYGIAYCC